MSTKPRGFIRLSSRFVRTPPPWRLQSPASARIGFALAASGAVLFSAKAILAKPHHRYGVDALDVLALRMA